ncbi:hypothetical protein GCM10010992_03900 [Cloacibacterium rupense]|uniref:Uncharacterized protein n=1 Tax=Cloacibacterium rupense TaxID=517423 RepID=A0ABQ2NF70_9FLAO|nr:hypothetical protein [Cloacibacterium rupense]GGP01854.1 hypothetical protein GCM10010992_03900 [Cloacibacterium rupense]
MKKLIFLAAFSLPLLVFSQTEKLEFPKVDMPKTEFPTIDLFIKAVPFDAKKFIVNISPAPWNMPVVKPKYADVYKILTVKPKENLEKMPIATPNE